MIVRFTSYVYEILSEDEDIEHPVTVTANVIPADLGRSTGPVEACWPSHPAEVDFERIRVSLPEGDVTMDAEEFSVRFGEDELELLEVEAEGRAVIAMERDE